MADDLERMPEQALAWSKAGREAVLATVIETWGSAPRAVGSQMVISGEGDMLGSVSGGCVEGAVVAEALDAVGAQAAKVLEFGVSDEDAFAVGLACGGRIRILLEPVGPVLPVEILEALVTARAARRPVAYVTDLSGGSHRLVSSEAYPERFRLDRSGLDEAGQRFIHIHNAPLRMVIVGAVHIAQALLPIARLTGYDVSVVDPRPAFANATRFPEAQLIDDWPDVALEQLGLDARTAVVTLTHDAKLDDPALCVALPSDAFYVGALGSTRTHAKRVARLMDAGLSEPQIARLRAPIGLDIGSRGPAEIAISIMAQVTDDLRKGGAD